MVPESQLFRAGGALFFYASHPLAPIGRKKKMCLVKKVTVLNKK